MLFSYHQKSETYVKRRACNPYDTIFISKCLNGDFTTAFDWRNVLQIISVKVYKIITRGIIILFVLLSLSKSILVTLQQFSCVETEEKVYI